MLTSEVYFRKPANSRPGRWWFAVLELGRLGQTLDRLICRRCRNKNDAHRQAAEALVHERIKRNEP